MQFVIDIDDAHGNFLVYVSYMNHIELPRKFHPVCAESDGRQRRLVLRSLKLGGKSAGWPGSESARWSHV